MVGRIMDDMQVHADVGEIASLYALSNPNSLYTWLTLIRVLSNLQNSGTILA